MKPSALQLGSDGHMATGCRFAPYTDSLKTCYAGPSSSQPLLILTILYHAKLEMSILFFLF